MLHAFRSLVSPELSIVQILPQADKMVLVARPKATKSCCPSCGCRAGRVHIVTSAKAVMDSGKLRRT
ncbi:hypothetical protein EN808_31565 [Mesorhizobium sp. M8A.F.Ca.ET.165.01.1.1]|nr:hypothetical protein EN808_31565 [Mesorhizobium sp. M8A.F.Ca.ET.165.01.1.1]